MRTVYVTFGQSHIHKLGEHTLDKDTVARIDLPDEDQRSAREVAQSLFGLAFSVAVVDTNWSPASIKFYPKGYVDIEVNL